MLAVNIIPPAKYVSPPTGDPPHALAAEHHVVGLGSRPGGAQLVERPLHGLDAHRRSPWTADRLLVRHADRDEPGGARRSDWRISPAWRSSYLAIAAARRRTTLAWSRRRRPPNPVRTRTSSPRPSTANAMRRRHEHLGEAAEPLRVIDDHALVAHG
jgi:hypothetical protein